jgi:ribosomal-protein-alanine N-acetyltransferase
MGTIGFWRIQKEHYRAEIGYLLHPSWQGKGIMREALKAVLDYGFQAMKLHSVEAHVNPSNASSIGLLEKCGFVREAYYRENYFYNGQFMDSAVYSLLAPE